MAEPKAKVPGALRVTKPGVCIDMVCGDTKGELGNEE